MEFILHITNPCVGSWSLYSTLLIPGQARGVYTPHYQPLCGVMEFILHITNPWAGSWSLYSALSISVRGRGVCSLVNRETLLELRSEFRLDALPAVTMRSSGLF